MKVLIYCRVATANQLSLEAQRKSMRDYAKKNNHEIVGESSDIGVYNTLIRPGFKPMFSLIEAGKVDAVLIKNLSRISRDFAISAQFVDKIISHKVKLLCVSEQQELYDETLIDSLMPEMQMALNLR